MKKIFVLLSVLFIFSGNVLADDFGSSGDLWDNYADDTATRAGQQKPVTDEQFNSIVDKLKAKRQPHM